MKKKMFPHKISWKRKKLVYFDLEYEVQIRMENDDRTETTYQIIQMLWHYHGYFTLFIGHISFFSIFCSLARCNAACERDVCKYGLPHSLHANVAGPPGVSEWWKLCLHHHEHPIVRDRERVKKGWLTNAAVSHAAAHLLCIHWASERASSEWAVTQSRSLAFTWYWNMTTALKTKGRSSSFLPLNLFSPGPKPNKPG